MTAGEVALRASLELGIPRRASFPLVLQLDVIAFELDGHDVLQHQAGPRLRPLVGSRDIAQRRPQGVLQRGGGLDRGLK